MESPSTRGGFLSRYLGRKERIAESRESFSTSAENDRDRITNDLPETFILIFSAARSRALSKEYDGGKNSTGD